MSRWQKVMKIQIIKPQHKYCCEVWMTSTCSVLVFVSYTKSCTNMAAKHHKLKFRLVLTCLFFSVVGHLIEKHDQITFNLCQRCMVENKKKRCSYQPCEQKLPCYHCSEVHKITSIRALVCEGILKETSFNFRKSPSIFLVYS